MKRSELVKRLGRDIEIWKDSGANGGLIELILDKCQAYGMEPPKREIRKAVMEFTSVETINEWEPEDGQLP